MRVYSVLTPFGGAICEVPHGGSRWKLELPHASSPWPHLWSPRALAVVWPLGQGIAEHIIPCKMGIVFPLKLDGKWECAPTGKIVLLVDLVVLELWLNLQKLTVIKVQPQGCSSVELHLGTLRGLY